MSSILCTDCGQSKSNYKTAYFSYELGDVVKAGEFVCDQCLDKRIKELRKEKFRLVASGG